MLYRPKLRNGKNVPLIWPLAFFRMFNGVCWPLEGNAPKWFKVWDRCYFVLFLIVFVQHNDAQSRFIIANYNNLDLLLSCLPAYLAQNEMTLRGFYIGLYKPERMLILQKFYADIYIENSNSPKMFQSIQRKLRPTFIYSVSYLLTLTTYASTPFISLYNQRRDLLFVMKYPYDIEPLYIYLPTIIISVWFSAMSVTMLFGEANIMSEIMLHLHGQYLLLGEDLQRSCSELLIQNDGATISQKFSEKLKKIIQRNVELNQFAAEFQKCFGFHIFVSFFFAAILLCALVFKVYTNVNESISFIVWMISKIVEMIAFGEIGSTLIATSNQVSSMYYISNWEFIISSSTNTHENIQMMKLLITAMETNRKPFILTGLNFFSVSLTAVLKILQGAASYFTCLIAIR